MAGAVVVSVRGPRRAAAAGVRGSAAAGVSHHAADVRALRRTAGVLRRAAAAGVLLMTTALAGCAGFGESLGYYWQSARGQMDLLHRAQPIDRLLAGDALPAPLRGRLEQVGRLRTFAVRELGLPDNASYRSYADLGRPHALWNVVAAPELSLALQRWCFPVAGCVSYRGYFDRAAGEAFRDRLIAQGLDVQFYGVAAYSTLGWFDDPVLSTFVHQGNAELARMLFHELTHQVVYVPDDSTFNESYATAVEQLGVERWLDAEGTATERAQWRDGQTRRARWLRLLSGYRDRLGAIYGDAALPPDEKRRRKAQTIDAMRAEYRIIRDTEWNGYRGYDRWFDAPIGNAHFGAVATYEQWVPAFRALWARCDGDFRRFHEAVRALSKRPPAERWAQLKALSPAGSQHPDADGAKMRPDTDRHQEQQ